MKIQLMAAAVLCLGLSAAEAVKDPSLLFEATFENNTLTADYAKGDQNRSRVILFRTGRTVILIIEQQVIAPQIFFHIHREPFLSRAEKHFNIFAGSLPVQRCNPHGHGSLFHVEVVFHIVKTVHAAVDRQRGSFFPDAFHGAAGRVRQYNP